MTIPELNGLQGQIASQECYLIDVREKYEHEAGHIPNSLNLPLSQLDQWRERFDKGARMILYCRTSRRSRRCAAFLLSAGYTDLSVLEGGFSGWSSPSK